jgi:hypothetical protein
MCEPATIALIAVAVAGAGAAGYSAYTQGESAKNTARAQAQVANNNKVTADGLADDSRKKGKIEEDNYRRRLEIIKGKQRSIYSGSGVVVDEGSPLDILGETAALGEVDALTIRRNAERDAYGFESQGLNFASQAQIYGAQARNIKPFFDGSTTFLTQLGGSAGTISKGFESKPNAKPSAKN